MRALLLYPEFPPSLWSFENILELVGRKVLFPPLGLATVAALLPASWEIKLVDCNIRRPTEEEWEWAQLVMISGMLAQKNSLLAAIREAKRRGKAVAVGGPYATALPDEPAAAGADYLALDEGEITVPMLLRALEEGKTQGVFRADGARPAMADSPMPRFDLYDFAACDSMSVQFTRGCPFCCEFCDVIELFGRAPRSKSPEQLLAELERLYELGWRRSVFIVDDNFIGDRNRARQLLKQLIEWQRRHYYPFSFDTQASIDLARDDELLRLMADANFGMIFLGIETPDLDSLEAVGKRQNTRQPMLEAIEAIQRAGMVPAAGLIIGFDGEAPGAGRRIERFMEEAAIPETTFSMLQALPNTALRRRLEREGRMLRSHESDINQSTLMNFVPTRPIEEIAREYVEAFCNLYDPIRYLERCYRCVVRMPPPPPRPRNPDSGWIELPSWTDLRAVLKVAWRQGAVRKSRWRFWRRLACMLARNPGQLGRFLILCAHNEHFIHFRETVRKEIERQIAQLSRG